MREKISQERTTYLTEFADSYSIHTNRKKTKWYALLNLNKPKR